MEDEKLLTLKEAANILGIHPNTLRVWTNQGLLPTYRLGTRRDRRFRRQDIQAFIDFGRSDTPGIAIPKKG